MATCSNGSSNASEAFVNHDNNESITIVSTYSANFTWRIRRCGYLSYPITCEEFRSYSDSRPEESDPVLWQLKLYPPKFLLTGSSNHAELGLNVKEAVPKEFGNVLRLSMTISVGSGDKPPNIVKTKKIMFFPMGRNGHDRDEIKMFLFNYDQFDIQDALENELVISFALVHSGSKFVTASHNCNIDEAKVGKLRTVGQLRGIYDDRHLTADAEIEVGGETIPVHRIILSMASKVFKTLFYGDFHEGTTSKVCIDDMTPEACKIMLGHIYSKPLPDVTSFDFMHITELLHAAEKYELDGLKAICGQRLCSSLCSETACGYYILSERYRVDALKACCKSYIKFHKRDVVKSESWEWLQADHPQLVQELSQNP